MPEADRSGDVKLAFRLEYFTLAWMTLEAAVAVTAGVMAHSIALLAFGLDSVIEFFAALVVIWQLRGVEEEKESRERKALRLIAVTFFALAAYVSAETVIDLVRRSRPDSSVAGTALAAAALVVMPLLFLAKGHVARRLDNPALAADARESLFCGLLAAVLLAGLAANAAFGWWWADPVAALVVAVFAVREGIEAWEESSGND
jgi:divalent metal cation (Fe/Co/Zn/Cd) transporter